MLHLIMVNHFKNMGFRSLAHPLKSWQYIRLINFPGVFLECHFLSNQNYYLIDVNKYNDIFLGRDYLIISYSIGFSTSNFEFNLYSILLVLSFQCIRIRYINILLCVIFFFSRNLLLQGTNMLLLHTGHYIFLWVLLLINFLNPNYSTWRAHLFCF